MQRQQVFCCTYNPKNDVGEKNCKHHPHKRFKKSESKPQTRSGETVINIVERN